MKMHLAMLCAFLSMTAPASASAFMRLGGSGEISVGLVKFCSMNNSLCRRVAPSVTEMTHELREELLRVNFEVNRSIRYVPEPRGQDVWRINVSQGDCADYVLAKQQALIQQGLPVGALHIALAYVAPAKPHAVLVVHTTAGDFVLDNRTRTIKRWDEVPYQWISLVITENPLEFRKIL